MKKKTMVVSAIRVHRAELGPSLTAALLDGSFEYPVTVLSERWKEEWLKHGGGVAFGDFEAEFLAFEEDDAAICGDLVSKVDVAFESCPAVKLD